MGRMPGCPPPCSSRTSLTQLSKYLSQAFKSMMMDADEMWQEVFLKANVYTPGSWVINSSKQVRLQMERLESLRLQPVDATQQTYDFSSMYTTLDLEKSRKKMPS